MTSTNTGIREPLRATVTRNVLIAIVASTAVATLSARSAHPIRWPLAFLLALWPTFGGHWLEVMYLEQIRPHLPASALSRAVARLMTWFIGGCVLGIAMALTARIVAGIPLSRWPAWWMGGVALIIIELVAHAGLQLRGQPSFYNTRG